MSGQGPNADIEALDRLVVETVVRRGGLPGSSVEGRDPEELLVALEPRRGPERLLDFMLRTGPYSDGFAASNGGLTLVVRIALELLEPGLERPQVPGTEAVQIRHDRRRSERVGQAGSSWRPSRSR